MSLFRNIGLSDPKFRICQVNGRHICVSTENRRYCVTNEEVIFLHNGYIVLTKDRTYSIINISWIVSNYVSSIIFFDTKTTIMTTMGITIIIVLYHSVYEYIVSLCYNPYIYSESVHPIFPKMICFFPILTLSSHPLWSDSSQYTETYTERNGFFFF